jgi:hypothetical protein
MVGYLLFNISGPSRSGLFVVRSFPTLRAGPGDVVERVFDVAGFAVQTIGEIKLDTFQAAIWTGLHFIDISRTKAGAGAAVGGITLFNANPLVVDDHVTGLVLAVKGAGKVNPGKLVHHGRVIMVG